jgi:CheY-like chemotaxis protein
MNKILMIDDDEDDRLLFGHAIKAIDPTIHSYEADDFLTAIEWLNVQLKLPDIIFLDLNIPPMNGFDCMQIIHENNDWARIPIIIYSTSGYCLDIEKAQTLGAKGYLKKPNDYGQVYTKLEKIIKHEYLADISFLIA